MDAYLEFCAYLEEQGVKYDIPYDAFAIAYGTSSYSTAQEFADKAIRTYDIASVNQSWYDNLGTDPYTIELSQRPNYSKYNLRDVLNRGDIIHETSGGVATITGHIAIVEGEYWDSKYQMYYIRLIESGADGVVYGLLDDTRYDDRGIRTYIVLSATGTQKSGAVSFCSGQVGKPYNWLVLTGNAPPGYSENTPSWYCSELVWAAYYNQGINLNGSYIPSDTYLPNELAASAKLSRIAVGS